MHVDTTIVFSLLHLLFLFSPNFCRAFSLKVSPRYSSVSRGVNPSLKVTRGLGSSGESLLHQQIPGKNDMSASGTKIWSLSTITVMATPLLSSLLLSLGNILHTLKMLCMEPLMCITRLLRMRITGSSTYDFSNKCVWITGAGSGIGKALAIECYRLGATIVVTSRSVENLREVEALCKQCIDNSHSDTSRLQKIIVFPKDLSNYREAENYYAELESKLKADGIMGVDVLFNVAGMSSRGSVLSTDIQTVENIMNINFMAPVALTKAVLPSMISRRCEEPRHVVVISSVQGKVAIPFRSTYSASKHAVQGYFDSLRSELVGSNANVRVMIVSPGYVVTNLSKNALNGDGSKYGITDDSTAKGMKPEILSKTIINGMRDEVEDLVVADLTANIAIYLKAMWPAFFSILMNQRARKH